MSSNLDGLSSNLGALSSKSEDLSSNLPATAGIREGLLGKVSGALVARVSALGQRNSPQEVRDIVLELCAQRAWRAEELATLLRRNTEYVRSNYLRPLLRNGRLQMTNPRDVNDPQQAYRTVDVPDST
jgi:ATP-dependent DNA helicase RecG